MLRKRVIVQWVVEVENEESTKILPEEIAHDIKHYICFDDVEKDSVHVTIEREDP